MAASRANKKERMYKTPMGPTNVKIVVGSTPGVPATNNNSPAPVKVEAAENYPNKPDTKMVGGFKNY